MEQQQQEQEEDSHNQHTRVDLRVTSNTIGISNALERLEILVGLKVGRAGITRLHRLQDTRDLGSTSTLETRKNTYGW